MQTGAAMRTGTGTGWAPAPIGAAHARCAPTHRDAAAPRQRRAHRPPRPDSLCFGRPQVDDLGAAVPLRAHGVQEQTLGCTHQLQGCCALAATLRAARTGRAQLSHRALGAAGACFHVCTQPAWAKPSWQAKPSWKPSTWPSKPPPAPAPAAVAHVLLLCGALLAVVGVAHAHAAADDAAALVGAVVALIAHTHERRGAHIRVTDGALSVALLTQPPDRCQQRGAGCAGVCVGRVCLHGIRQGRCDRARQPTGAACVVRGAPRRRARLAQAWYAQSAVATCSSTRRAGVAMCGALRWPPHRCNHPAKGCPSSPMPGCFMHMMRSGWCFAMAAAGRSRAQAGALRRARGTRRARCRRRCRCQAARCRAARESCQPRSVEGAGLQGRRPRRTRRWARMNQEQLV